MTFASKFLRGSLLLAFATFSVASEDCTGTSGDGVCSEPHDDDVALMALRGPQRRAHGQASLVAEEDARRKGVACPFKNVLTGEPENCDGAQCCPQAAETGNKTYPCPNAPSDFNSCQLPKLVTGGSVTCTFSATQCWGRQCCPGADKTSNKTYPCPSNPDFAGCETTFPADSSVFCPFAAQIDGSTAACVANQCCLGATETNGSTYPCPSSPSFGGCEAKFPTVALLQKEEAKATRGVVCPYAEWDTGVFKDCNGEQCCPAANETDKKTYPCPNAPGYGSCQSPYPANLSVPCPYPNLATGLPEYCVANQCCPGANATDKTYPCPSSPSYTGCSSSR